MLDRVRKFLSPKAICQRTLVLTVLASVGLGSGGVAQAKPQHPQWPPKSYAIYYGSWDLPTLEKAFDFDCIIFHPGSKFSNVSPEMIRRLKRGRDDQAGTADDVVAIAYVSVGEDEKVPAGPPAKGTEGQTGPTFRNVAGQWLQGKKGYPSKYLDEVAFVYDAQGNRLFGESGKPVTKKGQDGIPDENGVWGSFYTFPGDAGWHKELLARFRDILNAGAATPQAEALVDGFFLDTLDTASPWGTYGSTQPQMAELLQLIRREFPNQFIVANRGMFLIDKHSAAYCQSVDGVLFESLYTIWDWARGVGIQSPWSKGDFGAYKNQLLAAAQKTGFQLFFVNYINPKQSDFANLLRNSSDLIAGHGLEYISDPLLQKFYPPFSKVVQDESIAPTLGNLSVQELAKGRYRLSFELAGLGERQLGTDYFLDLRLSEDALTGPEAALGTPIAFDYSKIQTSPGKAEGSTGYSIESFGLDKATHYNFYIRGLGIGPRSATGYLSVSFKTGDNDLPAAMDEISATGLESSVKLTWKNPSLVAKKFRVYQGSKPDGLEPGALVETTSALVKGLKNGQAYYFSVVGVDAQGREGPLSTPTLVHPQDCTGPVAPAQVEAKAEGDGVVVSWKGASADTKTIKVYCVPKGENYRIPARVSIDLSSHRFEGLKAGHYWVSVTGMDANANESTKAPRIPVVIK